ncbi:bzip family transcription factor [Diplodia corticola]|uniref:Bzip family transcription factor n=1 Tax=Diplodia corticola TaxID=236234 RepID=A0A1J9RT63_9PEZI|nr:bzip family transcription factor [Diplodia corticola]OJD35739.1 bzip family transcription factor [Diplodia corticola]
MGSESEERPTKKRARQPTPSAEPISKGKKQRGRPKVDTQDETAADRRRTQIRLAQRAYRQRKEMTISSLQKQVEQLQSVIDGMNDSFLHFNDQAMASDIFALRPHLASELRSTSEAFVNLAKTAKHVDTEDEREDSQEAASDPSTTPQNAAAAPNISTRSYQDMGQAPHDVSQVPNADAQINSHSTHIGLGYYKIAEEPEAPAFGQNVDFYSGSDLPNLSASTFGAAGEPIVTELRQPQDTSFALSSHFRNPVHTDAVNAFQPQPEALGQHMNEHHQNEKSAVAPIRARTYEPFTRVSPWIPSPMNSTPRPAFTYSFQETTFSRRLQRACLERAFHLLSTAHLRPSDFNRVFRLCRHYSSRDRLLKDFRDLLQNSVLQPLDFLNSPFLHLGGAGTHYPVRDENGRVIPGQISFNVRRVGPYATKVQLEELRTSTRPNIIFTPELEYDLEAYGGEWLDSQDVEGYLEELGVHIDAQASFAETAVKTLDALARVQSPHGDVAHPDSEMGVLGEALDQFAPNHVGGNFGMSPAPQPMLATGSPGQASLPSSSSVPSASHGENSTSNGPSTPDSANLLQQRAQRLEQPYSMDWGEFPSADPKNWDEWDRFYDLNYAWADDNHLDLSEYGMGGVATVGSVEERRQNRSVTIDVQRFINGLIKRGVCIGRGPGFRRSDIHYALRAAIIEAF